jgi:NitT/TauT family transport system permease protein
LVKKHSNITNELTAKVTKQGLSSSFKPNHRDARKHTNKNFKQIFFLSFDALKDRKARSALTILMVIVGSALMVALNGMSAGQATFLNRQLNTLAPNVIFVSSGQNGSHNQIQNLNFLSSSNNNNDTKDVKKITNFIHITTNKESNPIWRISLVALVIDTISSLYRMFSALGLSFLAAILIGVTAARKPFASKIIIPIIDILQSVPILGFFPAAIAFFITVFNGSPIGIEIAAIFLIFTSMVWNMIFAVYESVLFIPPELLETTQAYRVRSLLRIKRLYLPASMPKLIYNSIMSWAGGWYFLTAAEIISLGSRTYTLHGLGSLLGNSVSSGRYLESIIALVLLILIILLTDFFFWRPLESYAKRFKYEYSSSSFSYDEYNISSKHQVGSHTPNRDNVIQFLSSRIAFPYVILTDFIMTHPRPLIHTKLKSFSLTKWIAYISELSILPLTTWWFNFSIRHKVKPKLFGIITLSIFALGLGLYLVIFKSEVIVQSISAVYAMYLSIYRDPTSAKMVSEIPLALLLSYLRLSAAYLIALAWTIPVAIRIAHSSSFDRIMPIFQTMASIPATAFFPFITILIIYIPGGLEFPSILLILTGMQWYILFNLIGGVRSISGDIEEVSKAFAVSRFHYIKRVLFPSIYPSFITGSITGWGGGWNSLIVSEYLVFGNVTYSVLGMGSLIDRAAYNVGNTLLLLLLVGIMSTVIVIINRFVWRRLYSKVIKKYSMST